jgi:K+-transporting ATPase ATPase A chain
LALTPVLGGWMHRVLADEPHLLRRVLGPVERLTYRLAGCDPAVPMTWRRYAGAVLAFNAAGIAVLLALLMFQSRLPFNPQGFPDVPFALALNTTISFVTNTNWQAYSGESTLSYLSQCAGLTVQNFVSAATGLAVLLALARGLASRGGGTLGNFWADLVRITLYLLLPLSAVLAVVLVGQGVVQSFAPYVPAVGMEGGAFEVPLGPAASQIAIKQLGTNGGGFFGTNSAHPFENPTPLSNFLQMLSILLLPAACVDLYGRMVGARRHAWAIFATMLVLFLATLGPGLYGEYQSNPVLGGQPQLEGRKPASGSRTACFGRGRPPPPRTGR